MPVLHPQGLQRHLGRRLCDPDSFYTRVALRGILDLLSTHSGGIVRANVVAMFSNVHLLWSEDPCIPEFINRFDDAQKKAIRASLPITDDWLAAMATSSLFSENSFPNDCPAWYSLVPSAQTWTSQKLKFPPSIVQWRGDYVLPTSVVTHLDPPTFKWIPTESPRRLPPIPLLVEDLPLLMT